MKDGGRERESEREKEKTVVVHVRVGMSVMSRGEKGARNNKFLRRGRRGAPTIVTRLRLFNLFPAVFFASPLTLPQLSSQLGKSCLARAIL